ncbi:MAG: hypothetical protein ACYTGZ_06855 [Planctomycetota bacterium]|jgi:hypothetical protein
MGKKGLAGLDDVVFTEWQEQRLAAVLGLAQGARPWRERKVREARELFALSLISPRLQVIHIDVRTEFQAHVRMLTPVACRENSSAEVVIEHEAILALRLTEDSLSAPQPGYSFVQIRHPANVFHPNVSTEHHQSLCLGVQMPAGIPVRELVLGSWAALTLQSIQLDEQDAAGVLNGEAALYWQQHTDRIPLTDATFLDGGGR